MTSSCIPLQRKGKAEFFFQGFFLHGLKLQKMTKTIVLNIPEDSA